MIKNRIKIFIKILEVKGGNLLNTLLPIQDQLILGIQKNIRLFPGHPENYDHGNLKMVLRPDHKKSDVYHYPMTYPYWNIDADIAHEV